MNGYSNGPENNSGKPPSIYEFCISWFNILILFKFIELSLTILCLNDFVDDIFIFEEGGINLNTGVAFTSSCPLIQ
jgi:hypothetical protein